MITEDKIIQMVDSAVNTLINDNPEKCAECMVDLARLWAKAGLTEQNFAALREDIIRQAEQRTCSVFIRDKLKISEQLLQVRRNEPRIIIS